MLYAAHMWLLQHYKLVLGPNSNWADWFNCFFEVLLEGFHKNWEKKIEKNIFLAWTKFELWPFFQKFQNFM